MRKPAQKIAALTLSATLACCCLTACGGSSASNSAANNANTTTNTAASNNASSTTNTAASNNTNTATNTAASNNASSAANATASNNTSTATNTAASNNVAANSENKATVDPKTSFLGVWQLEKLSDNALEGFSLEDISTLRSFGYDIVLNLTDGSDSTFWFAGDASPATWQAKSAAEGTITIDALGQMSMSLDNGKLTLADSAGGTMVFSLVTGDDATSALAAAKGESSMFNNTITEEMNVVVADDSLCTITVTGKGTAWTGEVGYEVTCVNNSDAEIDIELDYDSCKTNGKAEPLPFLSMQIFEDESDTGFMWYEFSDVESPDDLKSASGTMIVTDADGNKLAEYTFSL